MKTYKIIIASVAIVLLLGIASLPTLYSEVLIEYLGEPDSPEHIEEFYGDFDVEIIKSEYSKYYAYKIGYDLYLVIHYKGSKVDPMQIEFDINKGTDWIEEVTRK